MKPTFVRVLPGFVFVLAATVVLRSAGLRDAAAALLPALPWAVFAGGVVLGSVFRRSRLVLALVALGLTHWALGSFASASGPGRVVFAAVALLLPIDMVALSLLTERSLFSRRGRGDVAMLLVQVLFVAWISRPSMAPLAAALEHRFAELPLTALTAIPQPALLAFGLALLALIGLLARRRSAVESGLLWALVAAFLAFRRGRGGVEAALYLTAGGLTLVIAVVEASRRLAYGDELTGLPTRRALNDTLAGLGGRYAIAMVDIDHFKKFNDRHGHDVGDQLLRKVGATLAGVSGGGVAFRYGGEEFAVVFDGRSVEEALPHLEDLRKAVETEGFTVRLPDRRRQGRRGRPAAAGGGQVSVTISVGVAAADRHHAAPPDVLKAADAALYRAKRGGRNRVCL